ncbi:MAG TPA: hypothetical protein ENN13_00850 [Candidatus Altiarchaeales archaeon]|nr:hypothetical protein [Candidatus Altiarchaeales archaeon]
MNSDYVVDGVSKNLLEEDWDCLIILDACRFDFFERQYRNYFSGEVKRAISSATETIEWLNIVFPNYYDDIVYVSANPYVNSRVETSNKKYGLVFDGKKHFHKVLDVWDWGWDDSLTSIRPETVSKAFLDVKDKYPRKRFVLHYIQPHKPYIGSVYSKFIVGRSFADVYRGPDKRFSISLKIFLADLIRDWFGFEMLLRFKKFIHSSTLCQTERIGMFEGMAGVRKAYSENLNLVLDEVSKVVERMEGNVLITADHGEYLGENRLYGHGQYPRKPPISDVPWLEIRQNRV